MTVEADGVLGIEFVDPRLRPLAGWRPGAHLTVTLPNGLVRQYSLCGDPADRSRYQVAVLREVAGRGGSAYIHDVLRPGVRVAVRGPANHFELVDAPEYLFIAGGIGVTPLIPMVEQVRVQGGAFRFLYGGRSRGSMAYLDRLGALGEQLTLWPQDTHGLLDLRTAIGTPRPGLHVYCCGPEPLLQAVEKVMSDWPPDALHVERFAAPPTLPAPLNGAPSNGEPSNGGPLDGSSGADDAGFEVLLRRSGRRLQVGADQSVLDVLVDAGIDVLHDCREGICASCETAVVSGAIDHRDFVLSAAERAAGTVFMPCVSRAACPRLVLDL